MCELDSDCYMGYSGFSSQTEIKKSRKRFCCDECGHGVPVGSSYRKVVGTWDGEFFHMKVCRSCANAMDYLKKRGHGWVGGSIREDQQTCEEWEQTQIANGLTHPRR